MADEEKIVNVVFNYTTKGAEEAAAKAKAAREPLWGKTADDFYKKQSEGWDEMGKDFLNFQQQYAGGTANMEQRTKKLKEEMTELYGEMRGLRYAAMGLGQMGTVLTLGGAAITAGITLEAANYVKTVGNITEKSAEWLGYQKQIKEANLQIGQSAMETMLPTMEKGAVLMSAIANIVKENPWIINAAMAVGSTMLVLGTAATLISRLVTVVADFGLAIAKLATTGLGQSLGLGMGSSAAYGTAAQSATGGVVSAGGTAGAGGVLAFGTVTVASLIVGTMVGLGIGNFIGDMLDEMGVEAFEDYQPQNAADAYMTLQKIFQLPWLGLATVLAKMGPDMAEFAKSIADRINQINDFTGKILGASRYDSKEDEETKAMITQQEVQAYINYQEQMSNATATHAEQRLEIISQSEQRIVDVTQQYEQERSNVIADFARQQARAAENFARQQANALASYNLSVENATQQYQLSEQKAYAAFMLNQQKAEAAFHRQQQQAAKNHADALLKLEMQHNMRMGELVAQRDALGMVKEQARYEMEVFLKNQEHAASQQAARENFEAQRADALAAYNQQRADAAASFALQLEDLRQGYEQRRAEAQAAYEAQRAHAAQDHAIRLARMAEQNKRELEKIAQQEKAKLDKLDEAYKKQVDQIQTAFIGRLRALDASIMGDTAAFNEYMKNQSLAFQAWLDNFKASTEASSTGSTGIFGGVQVGTGKQYGGYAVFQGKGETGREEYVMDGDFTRMAEQIVGSRLNETNLMSAMLSGRDGGISSGGRNVNITVVGKTLSISEIRAQVDNALDMRLSELLPAFGGE